MKLKYTPKFRRGDIITGKDSAKFGIVLGIVEGASQREYTVKLIQHPKIKYVEKSYNYKIEELDDFCTYYSIADTKINRKLYPNGKAWNGEWRLC